MAAEGTGNSTPVTFATKEEFETSVATVASQMLSARTKQIKKEMLEDLNKQLGDFGKALDSKFETLGTQINQGGNKKKKDKDGEGDEPNPEESNLLRTMKKEIEELKKSNQRSEQKAAEADAKRQNLTTRSRLRDVLEQNGVTSVFQQKAAMAILIDSEKRVGWDTDADDAVYKDTDGAGLDLEVGVKAWLATEEGEHFVAPSGAGGSGSRPNNKRNGKNEAPQNSKLSEGEIGVGLLRSLGNISGQ